MQVISGLYPGSSLANRSALEFNPTEEGYIFLNYKYDKKIKLPGLIIQFYKSEILTEFDSIFFDCLFISHEASAFLENLEESRNTSKVSKSLSRNFIEDKLLQILKYKNETYLNQLRDQARKIALKLNKQKEFIKFNSIIGSLLKTQSSDFLISQNSKGFVLGEPIDWRRVELFDKPYKELSTRIFPDYSDKNISSRAYKNIAFFESYFSNYIEGAKFDIEEAKKIIETQIPIKERKEDSHYILGTYKIVSDQNEMSILPSQYDDLERILKFRHSIIMSERALKRPGIFKDKVNYAGNTQFVEPNEVIGTLKKGLEFYFALRHLFAKALFIKFLISEVHPFLDGNGRIARIMMNSELSSKNLSKIIIPTVFRDDYLGALRKFSRTSEPDSYVNMMMYIYEFSLNIVGEDQDTMLLYLKNSNAFLEHYEGKIKFH